MPKASSHSIWCVSVNPAIDKRARVAEFSVGRVNRVREVRAEPGGKAAHVAMVLRTLGADPVWVGFAGGATGEKLLGGLRELGIFAHPVGTTQETRVNLEIIDGDGRVTELLEPGAAVTAQEVENFLDCCGKAFSSASAPGVVVASGSLPPAMDTGFYASLTRLARAHGHKMFVDTSGEPLRLALGAQPDLVKPNREEAEALTGQNISDANAARVAAGKLVQMGAGSVVISLGEQGFVWQPAEGNSGYQAQPPAVKVLSAVGSGDATIAAFAYAAAAGLGSEETLRLAAACGAANCLAESPGRVRDSDVRDLQPQVRIQRLL